MQSDGLLDLIARVRRAMPRNDDVMALCDALAGLLVKPAKFDKTVYQREYMRRRRAQQRQMP